MLAKVAESAGIGWKPTHSMTDLWIARDGSCKSSVSPSCTISPFTWAGKGQVAVVLLDFSIGSTGLTGSIGLTTGSTGRRSPRYGKNTNEHISHGWLIAASSPHSTLRAKADLP